MALEGTLSYLDVAHLLQVVGASQKSGVLEITCEERRARLMFERGDLTCAESSSCHDGIGTLLVNAGLLSAEDLERALAQQRSEAPGSRRLGAILCEEFGIEADDIERLLRRQFERVALDVFTWPSGRFVFEFREPGVSCDRFQLDAVEFILAVGIQAGFLADRGLELEGTARGKPQLFFVDRDEALLGRYREHWQRKGYAVVACARPAEAAEALAAAAGEPRRVLLVGWGVGHDGAVGPEALRSLLARYPDVTAVALAGGASAAERLEARAAGAQLVVRRPASHELEGTGGSVAFEVFMVSLERALALALGAGDSDGAGDPG